MYYLKVISLVMIISLPGFGEEQASTAPKHAVWQSALIPGWGEHSHNATLRGYVFNGIEASLWIFAGLAYSTARSNENDLFYFASEYGQITNPHSKSDVFLDRVSKYDNMNEYNEQMLRNRQWDRIYSAENGEYWNWESDSRRQEYFDIKTRRYFWRQSLTYTFGAIALNHLVSTMDALVLKRQSVSLTVHPELGKGSAGMRFNLSF